MKKKLDMPMPVPAFPFPKSEHHCLLVDEDVKRLHQSVWDYASEARMKYKYKCDEQMEIEEGDSDVDITISY